MKACASIKQVYLLTTATDSYILAVFDNVWKKKFGKSVIQASTEEMPLQRTLIAQRI